MKKRALYLCATLIVPVVLMIQISCNTQSQESELSGQALVKRGEYLVTIGVCNDCHSPKVFTDKGPVPDTTRYLSGAASDSKIPAVPPGLISPAAWGAVGSNDMTVWAGPWGVSFAANLTPDQVTGIGAWSEDSFLKAMRTGKHLGTGRDILPPMPWPNLSKATDQDLKAIFAYLNTLKPVNNMVPQPIPPDKLFAN
jgi:cytochrome c553